MIDKRVRSSVTPAFAPIFSRPLSLHELFELDAADQGRLVPRTETTRVRIQAALGDLAVQRAHLSEASSQIVRFVNAQDKQPFLLGVSSKTSARSNRLYWRDRDEQAKWVSADDWPAVLQSKNLSNEWRHWLTHIGDVVLHLNWVGRLIHVHELELRRLLRQIEALHGVGERCCAPKEAGSQQATGLSRA